MSVKFAQGNQDKSYHELAIFLQGKILDMLFLDLNGVFFFALNDCS